VIAIIASYRRKGWTEEQVADKLGLSVPFVALYYGWFAWLEGEGYG